MKKTHVKRHRKQYSGMTASQNQVMPATRPRGGYKGKNDIFFIETRYIDLIVLNRLDELDLL